jgi:hypothetical protein
MDANLTVDAFYPKRLKAVDLNGRSVPVRIEAVNVECFGRAAEKKIVITFAYIAKSMILNRTNADAIANLYGPRITDWIGKKIILYAAMVPYGTEIVQTIRIKDQIPGEPEPESETSPFRVA